MPGTEFCICTYRLSTTALTFTIFPDPRVIQFRNLSCLLQPQTAKHFETRIKAVFLLPTCQFRMFEMFSCLRQMMDAHEELCGRDLRVTNSRWAISCRVLDIFQLKNDN